MKKMFLIVIGVSILLFGFYLFGNSYKNVSTEPTPTPVLTEQPKTSEEILTTKEGDKKVFNELGWKLYANQFIKPKPENEKECFKDMTTILVPIFRTTC